MHTLYSDREHDFRWSFPQPCWTTTRPARTPSWTMRSWWRSWVTWTGSCSMARWGTILWLDFSLTWRLVRILLNKYNSQTGVAVVFKVHYCICGMASGQADQQCTLSVHIYSCLYFVLHCTTTWHYPAHRRGFVDTFRKIVEWQKNCRSTEICEG